MATLKARDNPSKRPQSHNAADLFYQRNRGATFEDWQAACDAMVAMFRELGATNELSMKSTASFALMHLEHTGRLTNNGMKFGAPDTRIIIR